MEATFLMDRQTVNVIERIRIAYGLASRAEVLVKALALLSLAGREIKKGGHMVVIDGKNIYPIEGLPVMANRYPSTSLCWSATFSLDALAVDWTLKDLCRPDAK